MLILESAHGGEHSPPDAELREQRLGKVGRGRGDEDGIIRGIPTPTDRAVTNEQGDIRDPQTIEGFASSYGEWAESLDRVDVPNELRQHGRLETGTRSDLENPILGPQLQELHIESLKGGLRGGLAEADRDGGIFVRSMGDRLGNELVAWYEVEGAEDLQVTDTLYLQLFDEGAPLCDESVAHSARSHLSTSVSSR